jgi:hypothetical protein
MESLFFFLAVAFFAGYWVREMQLEEPEVIALEASDETDAQRIEQLENHVREMRIVWRDAKQKMKGIHRRERRGREAVDPRSLPSGDSLEARSADALGTLSDLLSESEAVLESRSDVE